MADDEFLQEATPDAETESTTQDTEPLIYIGPNIFRMALRRFQVFKGGLPPYVKRAIEKLPDIQTFLIPIKELGEMKRKIERPGTNESQLFHQLQEVK